MRVHPDPEQQPDSDQCHRVPGDAACRQQPEGQTQGLKQDERAANAEHAVPEQPGPRRAPVVATRIVRLEVAERNLAGEGSLHPVPEVALVVEIEAHVSREYVATPGQGGRNRDDEGGYRSVGQSTKLLSIRLRLGWRSLRSALASI